MGFPIFCQTLTDVRRELKRTYTPKSVFFSHLTQSFRIYGGTPSQVDLGVRTYRRRSMHLLGVYDKQSRMTDLIDDYLEVRKDFAAIDISLPPLSTVLGVGT